MKKSKILPWAAVVILSGFVCAVSAIAEVSHPDAYEKLRAFESYSPAQAPHLVNGVSHLSNKEPRFKEQLPLQLRGAMEKVKHSKYKSRKSLKNNS